MCREAACPLLLASSIKAGLDLDWSDPTEKASAVPTVATSRQIIGPDLEPEPDGSGRLRIRQGIAEDRRVSIEDKEMRHGRKTKSNRFNGHKRHLAIDLDTLLLLAIAVLPANRPEQEAAPGLVADITAQGLTIDALFIDRGYTSAPIVDDILARRGVVGCRPWLAQNGGLFTTSDFQLNMRDLTITCPAGEQQPVSLGAKVDSPQRDGFNPVGALEDAEQPYADVGRADPKAIEAALKKVPHAFAPPLLRDGSVVLSQVANITRYLGEKHGRAP